MIRGGRRKGGDHGVPATLERSHPAIVAPPTPEADPPPVQESDAVPGAAPTHPRHEAYLGVRTFASLDGLRCASILAVIWHHTAIGRLGWGQVDRRGFLGVDLFFVISGFLIVTLLLRERKATGGVSLGRFYARRSLRIFPLYFGVIGALAAASLLLSDTSKTRTTFAHDLPYLLTYTANWVELLSLMAVAWSLAAEEQFYAIWPPLEKYLPRWALLGTLAAFFFAIEIVQCGRLADDLGIPARFPPLDGTFASICLGVGLAHVLHNPRGFAWAARWFGHRGAPVVWMAVLILLVVIAPADMSGFPRLAIHLAMTGLLCACVVREDHVLRPLLAFRPLARIGVISYGMYLLHQFARHGADTAMQRAGFSDALLLFALCLLLTIAAAEISFRFYETPFLRLKALLASRRAASAGAVTVEVRGFTPRGFHVPV